MPPSEFGEVLVAEPAAVSIDGIDESLEFSPEFASELDVHGAVDDPDDLPAGVKPTSIESIDPDFDESAPTYVRKTIHGNLVN